MKSSWSIIGIIQLVKLAQNRYFRTKHFLILILGYPPYQKCKNLVQLQTILRLQTRRLKRYFWTTIVQARRIICWWIVYSFISALHHYLPPPWLAPLCIYFKFCHMKGQYDITRIIITCGVPCFLSDQPCCKRQTFTLKHYKKEFRNSFIYVNFFPWLVSAPVSPNVHSFYSDVFWWLVAFSCQHWVYSLHNYSRPSQTQLSA